MYKYIITGGNRLIGETYASGSKNASLPILAATIINGKKNYLYNVPDIKDVKITLEILEKIGCKVEKYKNTVIIDSSSINKTTIPDKLMRELRASIIIVGALLARFKSASFSHPGGCEIGARPIDLHLDNFKKIGIKIDENSRYIDCKCDRIETKNIDLDFPSVGATENLILASVLGNHEVIINNAAMEPEIVDLANFLNNSGAKIFGAGTNLIKIVGVKETNEVSYKIMPDRIEVASLLIAGAITKGNIKISNVVPEHMSALLNKLEQIGCKLVKLPDKIILSNNKRLQAIDIKTMPYPGFPTDMQPLFSTLLTTCEGTSIVNENIFENRFKFMNEIERMGAKITIEGRTMIISGVDRLYGAEVESTDLRGSASLIIAGLAAQGITKVGKLEYLLRGYENFDTKLNKLGSNIIKEKVGE